MNLRALQDLSPVAVVTGMVAYIRSKAKMDGYAPNSDAMLNASITMHHCGYLPGSTVAAIPEWFSNCQ
jgi:hypothetical protein